jgi:hypothetical protein
MVATGTGIAPYRAFWRRFFMEDIEGYKFTGAGQLCMPFSSPSKHYCPQRMFACSDWLPVMLPAREVHCID